MITQIVYKWSQALWESLDNLKTNTDRLNKAKLMHGLKESRVMLHSKSQCAKGLNQSQMLPNKNDGLELGKASGISPRVSGSFFLL